jgi:uncharacterized paraquat-inducible protein A
LACLAIPVGLVLGISTALAGGGLWVTTTVIIAGLVVTMGAIAAAHRVARHQSVHTLLQHRLRLCLSCRYILDGLEDSGSCPECGRTYHVQELKEGWTETYPELRQTTP